MSIGEKLNDSPALGVALVAGMIAIAAVILYLNFSGGDGVVRNPNAF